VPRSVPGADDGRVDTVRLRGTSVVLGPGATYGQKADELHRSDQQPGTVTIIRCRFLPVRELTVCRKAGQPRTRGESRPASRDEVRHIARLALAWL
jgi:hypothetical protein